MTTRRPLRVTGRARRSAVGLVVLVVLVGVAAAPSAGAANGSAAADAAVPEALAAQVVDADDVLLRVDLRTDGTAAWRVEYRLRLDDENATSAFEELQADVEANRSAYADRFADRMATTVAEAEAATGRDMALRDVSVETSTEQLPQQYGVLAYTFEWTGFARVEGDRLAAGDALAGLFLDAETSLLVSWPADHGVVEVSPEPTERRESSALWRGPTDFGPGEPTLVVAPGGGGPGGLDPSLLGLAVVVLVLVGGGLAWWRRRGAGGPAAGTASGDDDVAGAEEGATPPDELLSNEERVLALLEERGGRMKQQDVVEALGWTDAKTSQVVGKLRDGGRLEGFRLGRENVLRLPDVDESPVERAGLDDAEGDDAGEPGGDSR